MIMGGESPRHIFLPVIPIVTICKRRMKKASRPLRTRRGANSCTNATREKAAGEEEGIGGWSHSPSMSQKRMMGQLTDSLLPEEAEPPGTNAWKERFQRKETE